MNISTLSYCAALAHRERRDWFWASLFAPASAREALYALYALDIELAHVHHAVSEEMIGHIRYAWWQEGIEALKTSGGPQAHPVFEAIREQQLSPDILLPLVESYREHFPNVPKVEVLVQQAAKTILENRAPHSVGKWEKATGVIARHRAKHGGGKNSLLIIRLLFL